MDKDQQLRKAGDPHPQWEMNKFYLNTLVDKNRKYWAAKNIRWQWKGVNRLTWYLDEFKEKRYLYDVYTHLEIAWNEDNKLYAIPINLHIDTLNFKEKVDKMNFFKEK